MISARFGLGSLADDTEAGVSRLAELRANERLWAQDDSLFGSPPAECADRMGWLEAPIWADAFAEELAADARDRLGSVDRVVVMGMGGSSLFPEVLGSAFVSPVPIQVLDTTHPHHLLRLAETVPIPGTAHVVSSKSGSTVETSSQLAWMIGRGLDPDGLVVVTDPGSSLDELARRMGVAWTVHGDPDVGGRFSAFTGFGMVPAVLSGIDPRPLIDSALDEMDSMDPEGFADDHEAAWLAAAMVAASRAGRAHLTLLIDRRAGTFGDWLEQLISESLGKHGSGVVPVLGEPLQHVLATPESRFVVTIGDVDGAEAARQEGIPVVELSLEEVGDLGAHVVLWEVATALAGVLLGCNPFDQPDVESAKVAARRLLDRGAAAAPIETEPLDALLGDIRPGDCLHVCAFIDPSGPHRAAVAEARLALGQHLGVATTFGIGPRFLHSSGQLHKGGPTSQVVLQVLEAVTDDVAVPDAPFTFGQLIEAQAGGDLVALRSAGRRAARVDLDELVQRARSL